MKFINDLKNNKPITFSLLVVIFYFIMQTIVTLVANLFNLTNDMLIGEIIMIILPLIFVLLFSSIDVYKRKGFFKGLGIGAFLLVLQCFALFSNVFVLISEGNPEWVGPLGIVTGIVSLFGVGFREESLFRGIVTENIAKKYCKDRKGVLITVLSSGFLFGFVHIINLFYGVNLFNCIIQILVAAALGCYFAAVYLRGKSIWSVIFLHSLTDTASLFAATFTLNNGSTADTINSFTIINLTPMLIFGLATLFLLRKKKMNEILENNN